MCEDRIEAAFDQKGIVAADYDLEQKKMHVVYKTKKWDEERLHKLATGVGHDTDKYKADDELYANIHGCCKYRDPKALLGLMWRKALRRLNAVGASVAVALVLGLPLGGQAQNVLRGKVFEEVTPDQYSPLPGGFCHVERRCRRGGVRRVWLLSTGNTPAAGHVAGEHGGV